MTTVLVFPQPAPVEVTKALDVAGYEIAGVESATDVAGSAADAAWSAAVLVAEGGIDEVLPACTALRELPDDVPVLVVVAATLVDELGGLGNSFDDFCVLPPAPGELAARLGLLLHARPEEATADDELIVHGALRINTANYQAAVDGQPLDLTYMEYELLKYLAERPGRVCTREVLLSQVWGYDYYGGARTVDVHVRRLRAKLGEPHAGLITTVRSVGYRFGRSRWA